MASFYLAIGLVAASFVAIALSAFGRSPITAPLDTLEIHKQLLAGSDALLERMVIPPNRPDWVLMDCSGSGARAHGRVIDRVRHELCEAAGKTQIARD